MGQSGKRLLEYGAQLIFEHSHCLIALVNEAGELIDWNRNLGHLLDRAQGADTILHLLDASSRPAFIQLLQRAYVEQKAGPAMLHFIDGPTGLMQSYRCQVFSAPEGECIMLAEPIGSLDQHAAEQYMRIAGELALTTRKLQRVRHELEHKTRLHEVALSSLEQIAYIDDLTRLTNRRGILLKLQEEIERATLCQCTFSIILIDVDYFKQINDRYGHQAGDQVLRACANLLRCLLRRSDHLGRYGGEEFLAILPMSDATAAEDLAERLCRAIEREPFTVAQTITLSMTISLGVAEFDRRDPDADLLISRADSALFVAKTHGRNCHASWSPGIRLVPRVS